MGRNRISIIPLPSSCVGGDPPSPAGNGIHCRTIYSETWRALSHHSCPSETSHATGRCHSALKTLTGGRTSPPPRPQRSAFYNPKSREQQMCCKGALQNKQCQMLEMFEGQAILYGETTGIIKGTRQQLFRFLATHPSGSPTPIPLS